MCKFEDKAYEITVQTILDHNFFGKVLFSDQNFFFLKSDELCCKLIEKTGLIAQYVQEWLLGMS